MELVNATVMERSDRRNRRDSRVLRYDIPLLIKEQFVILSLYDTEEWYTWNTIGMSSVLFFHQHCDDVQCPRMVRELFQQNRMGDTEK